MFFRDDLDSEEYAETRNDTLEQLREFGDSLSRMKEGNLSLINDLNRIQLVCRSALQLLLCLFDFVCLVCVRTHVCVTPSVSVAAYRHYGAI